jgi:hypothetical protein
MTLLAGRLEEIANEATEYCKTQPREIAGFMWEKKFAELIIKECGDIADDYVEHGIPSAAIDKHFGIQS